MTLFHVGLKNYVNADRVIAILKPNSAPTIRTIQAARQNGTLIDCTSGRKTLSVLFTDSRHIILSALQPETLGKRWIGEEVK